MDKGLGLLSSETIAIPIKADPRLKLLFELPPRYEVFLDNLADLLSPPKVPPLETTTPPGTFWTDVFVRGRMPWRSMQESIIWHLVSILLLWSLSGQEWVLHREPHVRQHSARESHITYYPPSQTYSARASSHPKTRVRTHPQPVAAHPRPLQVAHQASRAARLVVPPDLKSATASRPNLGPSSPALPPVPLSATERGRSPLAGGRTSDCGGWASSGCVGHIGAARRRAPGECFRRRTSSNLAGVDAQDRELVWRFVVGRGIAGRSTAPFGAGDGRNRCGVLVGRWGFPSHPSSAVGCRYGSGWERFAGRCGHPGGSAATVGSGHGRRPNEIVVRRGCRGGAAASLDPCHRGQRGAQRFAFTIRQWCANHSPATFDAWCGGLGRARQLSVRTRNKGCAAAAVLAGNRFQWRGRTNQRVVWTGSIGGPAASFSLGHGRIRRGAHRLVVG